MEPTTARDLPDYHQTSRLSPTSSSGSEYSDHLLESYYAGMRDSRELSSIQGVDVTAKEASWLLLQSLKALPVPY
jgi:hypothetical protein